MGDAKNRTKRDGLRFAIIDGHRILYRTEFDDGEARLVNISGSGCAVDEATVSLSEKEKVLLILKLENETPLLELSARVVRSTDFIAFKFLTISEDDKQRIVKYFAKKQRANL